MNEQEYEDMMAKNVAIACDQLTDRELNTLYMALLLGTKPSKIACYGKVAYLFTENNGMQMHPTTVDALKVVWENRCGKRK